MTATIHVACDLDYEVAAPSTIRLAITPAISASQHIVRSSLTVEPMIDVRRDVIGSPGHELLTIEAGPGSLRVTFDGTVEIDASEHPDAPRIEAAAGDLPPDVIEYTLPSRYCESDRLERFAGKQFGAMSPGFERVAGICNWVYDHLDYVPGSTDQSTTATDVLVQAAGVCRDYSHLGITLCRALGIPARYVSGYAVALEPPDFHGFFEAFIGGRWFLFDPTRMAPLDGLVRIATGRDAADAAFGTVFGSATLTSMSVTAQRADRLTDSAITALSSP